MIWQLEAYRLFAHTADTRSVFFDRLGEESQTGPAEYLVTLAIMLKGHYSFEAQCSLPGLTTAASAHQAEQSLPDQSSPNIMASNHLWGDWAKAPLPRPSCIPIFKGLQGLYKM